MCFQTELQSPLPQSTHPTRERHPHFFALLMTLLCVIGLSTLSPNDVRARDLQWQNSDEYAAISLRRLSGDALAVRQSVTHTGVSDQRIMTELTHLTSGCALSLHWRLPSAVEGSSLPKHTVSSIQRGTRQLARMIAKSRWPKALRDTKSLKFDLSLPLQAQLDQVTWFGCGWAPLRAESNEGNSLSDAKDHPKPTLPSGAKSTRAKGLGVLLGQEKHKEVKLTETLENKSMILNSDHWNFAVSIESTLAPQQEEGKWRWDRDLANEKENQSLQLSIQIVHSAPPLTPLKQEISKHIPHNSFKEWAILLDILSYKEGIIDGLGSQGTSREWAGLLSLAILPDEALKELSSEWCEAALIGALRSLPAWPHIFKAYQRPMKTLDGRLSLPIALERYLLKHPVGQQRREAFLQQKLEGVMLTTVMKRHFQDMISRVAFFANRPSQRHLISTSDHHHDQVQEGSLRYSFAESVGLVPRALSALHKLLSDQVIKASLGAAIGLEGRTAKLQTVWAQKSRSFFGRQLEVYEARARIEKWGRYLGLEDPETPALSIKKDLKYFDTYLNEATPSLSALAALDVLWGQHDEQELSIALNTMRPFPAGLVTSYGVLSTLKIPFINELSPLSSEALVPNIGQATLWLIALNRQLKRKWPYKLIVKLEDARAAVWSSISTPTSSGRLTQRSSWQSQELSVLDSFVSFLDPPPDIETKQNVDSKEMR